MQEIQPSSQNLVFVNYEYVYCHVSCCCLQYQQQRKICCSKDQSLLAVSISKNRRHPWGHDRDVTMQHLTILGVGILEGISWTLHMRSTILSQALDKFNYDKKWSSRKRL